MGATEIAVLCGVSRQRVDQLAAQAAFPDPIARLAAGRIWRRDEVEAWHALHRPQPDAPGPACSFCGKDQAVVAKLIAGHADVYICNECVELCADIIEDEVEST